MLNNPAPRRGALFGVALLTALVLAACGGGDDGGNGGNGATDDGGNGGGTTATVTDGTVTVSADDLAFDAVTIEAPAGEPFTIVFENLESTVHNISVYTEDGGDAIAQGDVIGEGETDEVEIPALDPGEYFFVCDVHASDMTGTLSVGE